MEYVHARGRRSSRPPFPPRSERRSRSSRRCDVRMPRSARVPRRSRRAKGSKNLRDTIDASVFVNAFNPHEAGHAESLRLLATIQEHAEPSDCADAAHSGDRVSSGSRQRRWPRRAAVCTRDPPLPHLTLVSLTSALTRQAAELSAGHRLRGADADLSCRGPPVREPRWCHATMSSVRVALALRCVRRRRRRLRVASRVCAVSRGITADRFGAVILTARVSFRAVRCRAARPHRA